MEDGVLDGIMVGRGALIKPWICTEIKERSRFWRAFQRRTLGYFRGGAIGDRETVLRLWTGALGKRRAGSGPDEAISAGMAVVSVPLCAGGIAGISADDAAETGGVCGTE